MTLKDIQVLIAKYKESFPSLKEKDKAITEYEIYCAWRDIPNTSKFESRRSWARATLGGSAVEYETRAIMLKAGQWVDPLWKMIDDGIARGTVRKLFKQTQEK